MQPPSTKIWEDPTPNLLNHDAQFSEDMDIDQNDGNWIGFPATDSFELRNWILGNDAFQMHAAK